MGNFGVFPSDYDVVGSRTLLEEGCFAKVLLYVRGHNAELSRFGSIKFITGNTGPETQVLVCHIRPVGWIDVVPNIKAAA